ncbi:MAG TPA: hypothetical protein VMM76_08635 [Pirellulaceae bacterium]|nr:hypothetical protein [Pirellulaceae bacterium]
MSNRKQRARHTATSGSTHPASQSAEDPSNQSRHAAHPPQRNLVMLSLSSVIFVMWISFLAYVAVFG